MSEGIENELDNKAKSEKTVNGALHEQSLSELGSLGADKPADKQQLQEKATDIHISGSTATHDSYAHLLAGQQDLTQAAPYELATNNSDTDTTIKAWRSYEFHDALTDAQKSAVPPNPAGIYKLAAGSGKEDELEKSTFISDTCSTFIGDCCGTFISNTCSTFISDCCR
jgi:mersacidin/lichenicidin family type 2 lantibiotic